MNQRAIIAISVLLGVRARPSASLGCAFFPELDRGTPQATLEFAARWPASFNEAVIDAGIEPGFATNLGASNASEIALANQAVADAFAAWEHAQLRFDVTFDAPAVQQNDPTSGFDIDLFAVTSSHQVFQSNSAFGIAIPSIGSSSRLLTNGQVFVGGVIRGYDLYIASDRVQGFATTFNLTLTEQTQAIQRLLMHEIGHAIGAGHPNADDPSGIKTNFDTDTNPLNPMEINGADPFMGVIESNNRDAQAIMSNLPCGSPTVCPAVFFTSLQNDDIGARDLLYPVDPANPPGTLPTLISGKRLLVKDKLGDDSQRKIVFVSRDAQIATPPTGGSLDPSLHGATLRVVNPNGTDDAVIDLPSSHWTPLGKNPIGKNGYRYLDKTFARGPCRVVIVKPGRVMRAVCLAKEVGVDIPFDLNEGPQGSLTVTFQFSDGSEFCTSFGGTLIQDRDIFEVDSGVGLFKKKDAPAPTSCPLP
jgi:hypothetical protein